MGSPRSEAFDLHMPHAGGGLGHEEASQAYGLSGVQDQEPHSPRLEGSRKKRRKVSLACVECRERKVRCDGVKPICGTCRRRYRGQKTCSYHNEASRPATDRHYIEALHGRIRHLEDVCRLQTSHPLNTSEKDKTTNASSPLWSRGQEVIEQAEQHEAELEAESTSLPGVIEEQNVMNNTEKEENSPVSAMGTGVLSNCHGRGGFFGESSAAFFFSQVQELFSRLTGILPQDHPRTPRRQVQKEMLPISLTELDTLEAYSLPPRGFADQLLGLYHKRIFGLYPFVHWHSVQNAYQRLWTSDAGHSEPMPDIGLGGADCSPRVLYSALNIMFALGLHFSNDALGRREKMSRTFFGRTCQLCRMDTTERPSLALVQTLLLRAQYLQSTNMPNQCWNIVGLACRVAQGLGLHISRENEMGSELEVEIRRRVWHQCTLLDTILSMALGRPATTSHRHGVPLPREINDEDLSSERRRPATTKTSDTIASTSFFVHMLKLNRILNELLGEIYTHPAISQINRYDADRHHVHDMIQIITRLDSKLKDFENDLPEPFQWFMASSDALRPRNMQQLQRNVLGERFLLIRVLLYRPMFLRLCNRAPPEAHPRKSTAGTLSSGFDLSLEFERQCAAACLDAATNLLSLVSATMEALGTGAGAWWYNSYYTFTSAMVFLLSELCPYTVDPLHQKNLDFAWKQCHDILAVVRRQQPIATELLHALEGMRNEVKNRALSMPCSPFAARSQHPPPPQASSESVNPTLTGSNGPEHTELHTNEILPLPSFDFSTQDEAWWMNALWEDSWALSGNF